VVVWWNCGGGLGGGTPFGRVGGGRLKCGLPEGPRYQEGESSGNSRLTSVFSQPVGGGGKLGGGVGSAKANQGKKAIASKQRDRLALMGGKRKRGRRGKKKRNGRPTPNLG